MSDELARRGYRVTGRVQGVGFRAYVRREARALGVDGWVRNAADGSVEAEAMAETPVLEAFEDRLRQGPPASRVAAVEVRELGAAERPDVGFEIRP